MPGQWAANEIAQQKGRARPSGLTACCIAVPEWARSKDGCLLTSLPSLSVAFLPEVDAIELTADCGLEGTRKVACNGHVVSTMISHNSFRQPKVFRVKFSLREIGTIFSTKVRNFKLWKMPTL